MKSKYYLLILLSGIALSLFSQTGRIEYTYDAAGNRLTRTIFMPSSPSQLRSAVVDIDEETEEEPIPQEKVYSDRLNQTNILIYPNPTKGILKVELTHTAEENPLTLQLYNMGGKVIINESNVNASIELDLSSQSTGTYLLKIISENGEKTWKIIKQ